MPGLVSAQATVPVGRGQVGFVIVLPNVLLGPAGLPRTGAEPGDVAAFFADAGDAVGIASTLGPVAWLLAVLFGAGAVSALRASPGNEPWALAGFAGLILQNATFTGVLAIRLALASTAGEGAAVLWALHDALFTLNGTFLATAMLGLSVAGLRAGLIRPWHGALGLFAAALQFTSALLTPLIIGGGPLGLLGLAGWLMWVGWIATYGIVLIRLPEGEQDQLPSRVVG